MNGLKLQFHWVPATLMIVSVPLGPLPEPEPLAEPDDPVDPEELQAASAAASSAAAPVMSKRLMGVPFTGGSRQFYLCCRR